MHVDALAYESLQRPHNLPQRATGQGDFGRCPGLLTVPAVPGPPNPNLQVGITLGSCTDMGS